MERPFQGSQVWAQKMAADFDCGCWVEIKKSSWEMTLHIQRRKIQIALHSAFKSKDRQGKLISAQ